VELVTSGTRAGACAIWQPAWRGGSPSRTTIVGAIDMACTDHGGVERAPDSIVGGQRPGRQRLERGLPIADIVYAHYNADPENARFFSSTNLAMAARQSGRRSMRASILACEDRSFYDRWRSAAGV
jgi:hypothetical protein